MTDTNNKFTVSRVRLSFNTLKFKTALVATKFFRVGCFLPVRLEKVISGLMQISRVDRNFFCCFRSWRHMLWNWNNGMEYCRFLCDVVIFQNRWITYPSEYLLSSDIRPSKNLIFYKVVARQGSSICNKRVRISKLLRCVTLKIAAREGCRVGQKMSYLLSCFLTEQSLY